MEDTFSLMIEDNALSNIKTDQDPTSEIAGLANLNISLGYNQRILAA